MREKDFLKYSLELQNLANNLTNNYGQDPNHIISEEELDIVKEINPMLLNENNIYDSMGDDDLNKYEKWLLDGEFF